MSEDTVVHLYLPVDAATGKLLYPNGDEVCNPRAHPHLVYRTTVVFAFEFLDRKLRDDCSWKLSAHALDTADTFTLSGGCDRNAGSTAMFQSQTAGFNRAGDWPDGSDPDPALGRLTFRLAISDPEFKRIAANPALRNFCSFTVAASSGDDSAVAARIPFVAENRTGEHSGNAGDDSDSGTPGNGTLTGLGIIADPIASLPIYDETWGYCRYLDTTFPSIQFIGRVHNLKHIRMEVVSIASGVAGNIVLIPSVDGVDRNAVIVAVGATAAEVVLDIEVGAGTLILKRNTSNPADTLQDGGAVTAVVRDIIFEVQYDA